VLEVVSIGMDTKIDMLVHVPRSCAILVALLS
jgi:hypothetical protein